MGRKGLQQFKVKGFISRQACLNRTSALVTPQDSLLFSRCVSNDKAAMGDAVLAAAVMYATAPGKRQRRRQQYSAEVRDTLFPLRKKGQVRVCCSASRYCCAPNVACTPSMAEIYRTEIYYPHSRALFQHSSQFFEVLHTLQKLSRGAHEVVVAKRPAGNEGGKRSRSSLGYRPVMHNEGKFFTGVCGV